MACHLNVKTIIEINAAHLEETDNLEEIVVEVLIDHQGKCTKQHVPIVEMKPKYPLFQLKEGLFIAEIVFRITDHIK